MVLQECVCKYNACCCSLCCRCMQKACTYLRTTETCAYLTCQVHVNALLHIHRACTENCTVRRARKADYSTPSIPYIAGTILDEMANI